MGFMEPTLMALGHAVLHFLWQGIAILMLAGAALALVPKADAALRHTIGAGALVFSLVAFFGTFVFTLTGGQMFEEALAALPFGTGGKQIGTGDASASAAAAGFDVRTGLAWAWMVGVLLSGLRCRRGHRWAYGLKETAAAPEDPTWQTIVNELCEDLGLHRAVRLLQSAHIDCPAVIGWFTPIIVVPVSTLSGLSVEQLRCVLAHELAHIQRRDHLVNAMLALVDMTLFFHPASWWLAGLVRRERELCCDLAAVRATGTPRLLAQALTQLESLRLSGSTPALAARSDQGPLMNRITQILEMKNENQSHDGGNLLRPAFLLSGLLVCAGAVQSAIAQPITSLTGEDTAQEDTAQEDKKQEDQARRSRDVEADRRHQEEQHRKEAAEKGRRSGDVLKKEYAKYEAKIKQAVAEGKLTSDQAEAKLIEMRKKIGAQARREKADPARERIGYILERADTNKDGVVTKAEAGPLWERLVSADANKDGKVTASEMYAAWSDRSKVSEAEAKAVKEKLKAAVAAGKITEAQAKERYLAWSKRQGQEKSDAGAKAKVVWAELESHVKAGKMTMEQAKARYAQFLKSQGVSSDRRRSANPEDMIKKVMAAVEKGDLTPAEGKAKIEDIKKGAEARKQISNQKSDVMKRISEIEAAVKAGRLTPDQGKEMILKTKKGARKEGRHEVR